MKVIVRPLSTTDREQWELLYYGYAAFYQVPMDDTILDTVWAWIFNSEETFYCSVAECADGELAGLMHFREMPSPLRGQKVGFLDDLFVKPDCRGHGVVEELFRALEIASQKNNWPLVRWITDEDNYCGRRVYDKLASPTH